MHMFHNAHAELAVRMHMHFGHRILHFGPIFSYTIQEAPCWNLFVRIPTKSRTANRRKKKEERKNRRGETTSRVYRLLRYPPLMYPLLAGTYPVPATAGTTTRAVHCASHIPTRDCVKLSRLCDVNVCDPPSRIPTRGFSPKRMIRARRASLFGMRYVPANSGYIPSSR